MTSLALGFTFKYLIFMLKSILLLSIQNIFYCPLHVFTLVSYELKLLAFPLFLWLCAIISTLYFAPSIINLCFDFMPDAFVFFMVLHKLAVGCTD